MRLVSREKGRRRLEGDGRRRKIGSRSAYDGNASRSTREKRGSGSSSAKLLEQKNSGGQGATPFPGHMTTTSRRTT